MKDIASVIKQVQGLLALSKSANVNEAALAARKANELIDKYRLSMADLEGQEAPESIEEDPDYVYTAGRVTPWKEYLLGVLAKHYGLTYLNEGTRHSGRLVSQFKFVGRRSDIYVAKYMYAWLAMECQRLADKEVKGMGRIFVASYCQGFVKGIADQLRLSRNEIGKDSSQTALVKLDARSQEAKDWLMRSRSDVKFIKKETKSMINSLAFNLGKKDGENIHLGKSMGENSSIKKLKA